jgi:hypothetical protein
MVLSAAEGGHARAAGPVTRPEAGLAEQLKSAAGGEPVFLLRDGVRVLARTVSRGLDRELGSSGSAPIFDDRVQLIWLRSEDRLEVLDLRAPKPAAKLVVKGVPQAAHLSIRWKLGDQERGLEQPGVCDPDQEMILMVEDRPHIEGLDESTRQPTLVGAPWLKQARARAPVEGARRLWFLPDAAKMKLPAGVGHCDDKSDCGRWLPFGKHGQRLVLIEDRDVGGHCPKRACLLYDPATKLYATPPGAARWGPAKQTTGGECFPYYFDASGEWVASSGEVCQSGRACVKIGGDVFGVLDGGTTILPN